MNSQAMYSEIILDYYRNPKRKGRIENAHVCSKDTNPSCGDVLEFFALVEGDVIKEIKYDGKGCAISMAAAEMLAEYMVGKKLEDVQKLDKDEILDLLGIPISGIRMKCALLGLKVLKYGVVEYLSKDGEEVTKPLVTDTLSPEKLAQYVRKSLEQVEDPELHMDIITLGLVRDITITEGKAHIVMTLTSPMCPFGPAIMDNVKQTAQRVDGVDAAEVELSFDPPWDPPEDIKMMLGV